jgi:hypothetical protein
MDILKLLKDISLHDMHVEDGCDLKPELRDRLHDAIDELGNLSNVIPDVNGSAEVDYWSNRCKLVEHIWENTPSSDYIEELADLEQEYHKFIKENGSKHYR